MSVTVSVGAALYPEHGEDADTLLQAADAALYLAKGAGKDRMALYSQALHSAQEFRRQLEVELRRAIDRDEFHLEFQPRYDIASRQVVAVEALLRWQHPQFARLPTDQFVAVAEASGLIGEIGRWVLGAACEQARRWREAGHPIRMAVNLSAIEFRHPNLPRQIRGTLDRFGLARTSSSWKSPRAPTWSARPKAPIPGSRRCDASVCGSPSTISAPAGRLLPI